jgi:hypothetical protein
MIWLKVSLRGGCDLFIIITSYELSLVAMDREVLLLYAKSNTHMGLHNSLDNVENIIAALLRDVHNRHGLVFNERSLRLTTNVMRRRVLNEGTSFLTKTLPKLGKAFDKALALDTPLNATKLGFATEPGVKTPKFLGEFFSRVLDRDGQPLTDPCIASIKVLRDIMFVFYKYELPYTDKQEEEVITRFVRTEDDLSTISSNLKTIEACLDKGCNGRRRRFDTSSQIAVTREARILLSNLFGCKSRRFVTKEKYLDDESISSACFDPLNIVPSHGPGVVATRQRLWEKFEFTNVSGRITSMYPFDAYFCASTGHVCDRHDSFIGVTDRDLSARVLLVPKDSRGPRLISCEPVDFQWVQQGLGRAIVDWVENHPITKWNVFFTNQQPNQFGSLLGSSTGKYSTLDLNEASDRVSVDLVRLLFPPHIYEYLAACRSLSTELPDGKVLPLNKFAPMGSSLCFPILALTVWAILTAGAPDADTREGILVYGDDVIVPTAYAENAMEHLESFGLKVNRDKSCTKGLFRESCGVDAFKGVNVTPVRIRTIWSSSPSPDVYSSWVAYANSFYDRQYYETYDLIVGELVRIYGPIPETSQGLTCPSIRRAPVGMRPLPQRVNKNLQKLEFRCWDVKSPGLFKTIDGWLMLLRYFTEGQKPSSTLPTGHHENVSVNTDAPFSVSSYTKRNTSMLVKRWR